MKSTFHHHLTRCKEIRQSNRTGGGSFVCLLKIIVLFQSFIFERRLRGMA